MRADRNLWRPRPSGAPFIWRRPPGRRCSSCIWPAGKGMEEIRRARSEGQPVYRRNMPAVSELHQRRLQAYGRRARISSARRPSRARTAGTPCGRVSFGEISPRWPPTTARSRPGKRSWGREDFTKSPTAAWGRRTMYPYMLGEANKGRLTFQRAVELVRRESPRKFSGFIPQKGTMCGRGRRRPRPL